MDSFEEAKADIVKCIELVENDTDRFYDFINFIIKEQVDVSLTLCRPFARRLNFTSKKYLQSQITRILFVNCSTDSKESSWPAQKYKR